MFATLPPPQPDKIIELMAQFRSDPRSQKVDLGVGVYKDATGHTPIMQAVKRAEQQLWTDETTKTYTGLAGDEGYRDAMVDLVLKGHAKGRTATAATPGGTGALRNGLELARLTNPDLTIWISAPTWPNHPSIIDYLKIPRRDYRYYNAATGGVDVDGMLEDLKGAKTGDLILLHGCCHNPTGANLRDADWHAVADLLRDRGLIPFVDIAYQGFGDGLSADSYGVRHLADTLPEMIIAASCSKNFGIYRDRAGCLITVSEPAQTAAAQGSLTTLNRLNFSFPPDHGTRLVDMILNDPNHRASWEAELGAIRTSLVCLRRDLASALRVRTNSDRFGFLAQHRGMFSLLGLNPAQLDTLRDDHGVYIVGDSRMNVAGLSKPTIPIVADAIAAVL